MYHLGEGTPPCPFPSTGIFYHNKLVGKKHNKMMINKKVKRMKIHVEMYENLSIYQSEPDVVRREHGALYIWR